MSQLVGHNNILFTDVAIGHCGHDNEYVEICALSTTYALKDACIIACIISGKHLGSPGKVTFLLDPIHIQCTCYFSRIFRDAHFNNICSMHVQDTISPEIPDSVNSSSLSVV